MMYSVQQSCKIVAYLLHTSLSTVFNARNSVLQKLKFKSFKLKRIKYSIIQWTFDMVVY